jgi:hypothetical protein
LGAVLAAIVGWAVLIAVAAAVAVAVGRRARANGIMAPLVVGVLLRLVVMIVAHVGSVSLGNHGIFFLDDQTYRNGATLLADNWRGGHTPDLSAYNVTGTYQFGYQAFLAAIFTLGTPSLLLGKLVNVLLGGVSIYLTGRLGGRLLGERAKVRAAWVAALAPGMVWWSAALMKETLSTVLLLLGLLALVELPRRRAVVTIALVAAAFAVVRTPAAVALIAGAGVAVAIAGRRVEGRLLSRPLIVFGSTLVAGLAAVTLVVSRGDVNGLYHSYDAVAHSMIHAYQGGNLANVPVDALKSLVTPVPWAFDIGTRNWDRMLYPGVWLLICALPLAAAGAWRMRRSAEGWGILVTAATVLLINVATAGFLFRQRSMIEPLIMLLALAGATSWRMAARTAAAALGVTAAAATVQSGSAVTGIAVAAAAGVLSLVSRRLPSTPFDALPDSQLVSAFRESAGAEESPTASAAARVQTELAHTLRTLRRWAAEARAALARRMPRMHDAGPEAASASPGQLERSARRAGAVVHEAAPALDRDGDASGTSRLAPAFTASAAALEALRRSAPSRDLASTDPEASAR